MFDLKLHTVHIQAIDFIRFQGLLIHRPKIELHCIMNMKEGVNFCNPDKTNKII